MAEGIGGSISDDNVSGDSVSGGSVSGRPLRVAAHNGAPVWGGAEIATARLLSGLQDRGHAVTLFYNRELVADGARRYGLEVRPGYLGGDIALHHAVRFALQLRRFRPDVLVVGTFRKLWLASLAARIAGVPVVARIGLSSDVPRSAKYRFAFRHLVARVITNADDVRREYERRLPGAPPPVLETIHKGIDVYDPSPDQAGRRREENSGDAQADAGPDTRADIREELGVTPGALLVGGVGRLAAQKRFDRLIEAVAQLTDGTELLLVGEGALREELESLAADLGVADRVRFTGHREDVMRVMSALDLLVVSSDRESLANVMLEAMAAGVPVLSTPVSGAREVLEREVGAVERRQAQEVAPGLVVEGTVEGLRAGLERLLAEPVRLSAMGAAARRRVAEAFDQTAMLDAWERSLAAVATAAESESASVEEGARS